MCVRVLFSAFLWFFFTCFLFFPHLAEKKSFFTEGCCKKHHLCTELYILWRHYYDVKKQYWDLWLALDFTALACCIICTSIVHMLLRVWSNDRSIDWSNVAWCNVSLFVLRSQVISFQIKTFCVVWKRCVQVLYDLEQLVEILCRVWSFFNRSA